MAVQLALAFLQALLLGAVAGTASSALGWAMLGGTMMLVVTTSLVIAGAGMLDFVFGLLSTIIGYDAGLMALLIARHRALIRVA